MGAPWMRKVWIVLGALALLIAALTPALRLERVRACETVVAGGPACLVRPKLVDAIDSAAMPAQIREQVLVWQIERSGAYELDLHPSSTAASASASVPAIRVEDALGQTVSALASEGRAKTRTLAPGAYRIYVTGAADTPRELVLGIAPLPPATAAN